MDFQLFPYVFYGYTQNNIEYLISIQIHHFLLVLIFLIYYCFMSFLCSSMYSNTFITPNLSVSLSIKASCSEVLLFFDFKETVSLLYHTFFDLIMLLYTFL